METTYNSLKLEENWFDLFYHLLDQSKLCHPEQVHTFFSNVFGGELHNAVGLLLQGLTPVRFSFLDGQGRITSLHYYLRRTIPRRDGKVYPIIKIPKLELDATDVMVNWNIARSGVEATCYFFLEMARDTNDEEEVSNEKMVELNKNSKVRMDSLVKEKKRYTSIVTTNLSSVIFELLEENTCQPIDELANVLTSKRVIEKCKFVLIKLYDVDEFLRAKLFGQDTWKNTIKGNMSKHNKLDEAVFELLGSNMTKVFPSLLNQHSKSPVAVVLLYILVALLDDPDSCRCFRGCMSRDWITPIETPLQVGGVALHDLHPGTFVNESMDLCWFYPALYKVSD